MILEAIASYFALPDSIQVAVIVQEDDGTTVAPKVVTGTVAILHGDAAMVSETFTANHRVYWINGTEEPEDRGQFYFFFHHPQVRVNMKARVNVTLADGRTASQTIDIDSTSADIASDVWQNPVLSGRPVIQYDRDEHFPVRPQDGSGTV